MESGKPADSRLTIASWAIVTWMSNLLVRHSDPILIISGSILGIDLILQQVVKELVGGILYAL
jgi:hypothetical protein